VASSFKAASLIFVLERSTCTTGLRLLFVAHHRAAQLLDKRDSLALSLVGTGHGQGE
jgi:hypothetical protein